MRTHLGASSELDKAEQLPEGWTNNCRLLHCEGYCLYKPELARGAMQAAKAAGAEVCRRFKHLPFVMHSKTDEKQATFSAPNVIASTCFA